MMARHMTKYAGAVSLLCLIGVLSLAVAACGNGATGAASGTPTNPPTTAVTATATTSSGGSGTPNPHGSATISTPFQLNVTGALCTLYAPEHVAGFVFPSKTNAVLGFDLGPDPTAPGQGSNPPFTGPGTYSNITISVRNPSDATQFEFGQGSVTLNSDNQTGAFQLDDHSASGTFNCGAPIG